MNPDVALFNWSKVCGGYMQAVGESCISFSNAMTFNPFWGPISDQLNDYGRFLVEKWAPLEDPEWGTPNTVVYEGHKVALRKFNREHLGNPVILVAPEAGHDSHIVDYGPEQSLVQCALDHFGGDVYAVDKLPAGPKHTNYSVDDSIQSLKACVEAIGEPVHLIGLCQGGWQSAIFAALFPEDVKSLTLAAAPIDFHAGDALVTQWACSLPFSLYQQMVRIGSGNMPGCYIVQGFMMMNPYDRFVGDDMDLMANIADPVFIERRRQFAQWYYRTQSVPGTMYLQVVDGLFRNNRLIKGELEILGRPVDLACITQPLFMVAGQKDDITPAEQLFATEQFVRSKDVHKAVVPAGHIGVFMGKQVVRDYWTNHFSALSEIKSTC